MAELQVSRPVTVPDLAARAHWQRKPLLQALACSLATGPGLIVFHSGNCYARRDLQQLAPGDSRIRLRVYAELLQISVRSKLQ